MYVIIIYDFRFSKTVRLHLKKREKEREYRSVLLYFQCLQEFRVCVCVCVYVCKFCTLVYRTTQRNPQKKSVRLSRFSQTLGSSNLTILSCRYKLFLFINRSLTIYFLRFYQPLNSLYLG